MGKKEQTAAADPTHYWVSLLGVQWESGLPSPADMGLVWEWGPLAFPVTQGVSFSPFSGGAVTQGHGQGFKGKGREEGGEFRRESFFFLFLFQTC